MKTQASPPTTRLARSLLASFLALAVPMLLTSEARAETRSPQASESGVVIASKGAEAERPVNPPAESTAPRASTTAVTRIVSTHSEATAPAPGAVAGPSAGAEAVLAGVGAHLPWSKLVDGEAGRWVEYALLVGGYPMGPYLRFLVMEAEVVDGVAGTWVEIWISQRPGSASQAYRLLVTGDPSQPGGIRKAAMRLLGGKIREIPPEDLLPPDPTSGGGCRGGRCISVPRLLPEKSAVLTPAGSFESQLAVLGPGGRQGTKAWFSSEVPLFGLVRLELASQIGLELHAMGSDGKSVMQPRSANAEAPPAP